MACNMPTLAMPTLSAFSFFASSA